MEKNNVMLEMLKSKNAINVNGYRWRIYEALAKVEEIQGKKFYQHPGVGNLRPYNDMGNPAGGCFTMHTMA